MAPAEAGDGGEVQPLGLGPRIRRSKATRDMAGAAAAGGGEEGRQREVPLLHVLALTVALPLPVAVSRMDAGVPRKARTSRPRAKPSGWWAFRLPVPQLKKAKNPPEEGRSPRPQRGPVWLRAPSSPDFDAAAPVMEKPAKKARRCLQCGSAETPQWRSGPMGRSTLCNACGVRLRAAGALRETEHCPPPATARMVAEPPPPESLALDSPPDSPICEHQAPLGDIYLVRKQPKRTPKKKAAPAPAPESVIYLVKKTKNPWTPRNTGQKCLHCGTTSTPQWREGPMGRHTLCNACGVRYRQGRLLPEYRPAASPTFVPSEHASRHREVLQLHRQRQNKKRPTPIDEDRLPNQRVDSTDAPGSDGDDPNNVFLLRRQRPDKDRYPPTPPHRPLPQPVDDDPRVGGNDSTVGAVSGRGGGDDLMEAPSPLDSLLLDGPSAPPIVDGDEFVVS